MALVEARNLSFSYSRTEGDTGSTVIGPFTFDIDTGEFVLFTGLTGCGKTTLLRAMKPELTPNGTFAGSLEVCGKRVIEDGVRTGAMDSRFSAENVGFVLQDPDAQIVCDTVWHELAFGLENIGCDPDNMRRRVAEAAHYFGIAPWVEKSTDELSGGQKQLLNLASVLSLRPQLILLDEPTAQLDPSSKQLFAAMISRVHRELGITVVMATHMPEDMADFATRTIQISDIGQAASFEALVAGKAAAGAANAANAASSEGAEGAADATASTPSAPANPAPRDIAVRATDVFVRHNPDDPWVLHGFDLEVRRGTVHVVVGGNGSGKTTLLRTLAGDMKPRRGKVENKLRDCQAFLPQDPKAVFVMDTIAEELAEWQERVGYTDDDIARIKQRFDLEGMDGRHPYDLSGGQRQNLAFAKLLLCNPKLMFLDEPTKGLDARACANIVRTIRQLADEGVTIVMSTHDLDVAAACADEATLVFDGQAVCTQSVPAFFEDNLIWRPHPAARLYGALL